MTEARKKRRLGMNMKPRGEQAQRSYSQPTASEKPQAVSTEEGQPESILKPVLERIEQAETSTLATQENGPKSEDSVQILESKKAENEAERCTNEEEIGLEKA